MIVSDGINHGKLQSIIVGELKKVGLKHRLKKIISKNVKDNKTVFGAPLIKAPSCSVVCCGSTLNIPVLVSEMSSVLWENAYVEGLFRKAGSQARQKDIKRQLDSGVYKLEGHHPIDIASVFKLYLRTLPEPLISVEVQDLLLRCRLTGGDDALNSILHTLLLLPVLHVHLLHYIMELLNFIASKHKENLMDSSNIAIVMAPSIMPLPATSSAQRLEHHVALVKIFIDNSKHIGILSDDLMSQLDDDSEMYRARRKKRRSGSLNRVFNGLRKMVSGSVNTPATFNENRKTPVLSKSASKRKLESHEGLSAKTRQGITRVLPQKELTFTPMKMGTTERKRLRLSMVDIRKTPITNSEFSTHKNSETSVSSEDVLTSTEHLFNPHNTIDLSPDHKPAEKDYVRISKQEYEEIKNRVSAIENRLSREFTEVIPNVEPLQRVQNVYQQTLEEVAMLDFPTSDHLARRLSKELKIRPEEQNKIIRSPSARKIGSIRRRSKENVTKIVRHKSWNAPMATQPFVHNNDKFYPNTGLAEARILNSNRNRVTNSDKRATINSWNESTSENSPDTSNCNQHKYTLRKRASLCDYNLSSAHKRCEARQSLNSVNSWDAVSIDRSMNNSSDKSQDSSNEHLYTNVGCESAIRKSPQPRQKWRNAAAFFIDKTGEVEANIQTGRPSVNKLRRQNAGAVLAKAKLFESSSDQSSEKTSEKIHNTGFARKPRLNNAQTVKNPKMTVSTKNKIPRENSKVDMSRAIPKRLHRNVADNPSALMARAKQQNVWNQNRDDIDNWQKKIIKISPPRRTVQVTVPRTSQVITPIIKKNLLPSRNFRSPICIETKKVNTPLRALPTSPRRRSPRLKIQQQTRLT